MSILERLRNRKDRGDAVLTTVLISIPLLLISFAFATGVSLQVWQKQAYTTAAQSAVTSALQKPEPTGYLGINAMQEFVNQYLQQTGRLGVGSSLTGPVQDRFVANGSFGSNETGVFACTTANIPGIGQRDLPYIEMTLDISRNGGDTPATLEYISQGITGNIIPPASGRIIPGDQYRVLNAVVYEATQNVTAFGVGEGFAAADENNCTVVGTQVSAILFGNQEDLVFDQACPQPEMAVLDQPKIQQANSTPTVVKTSPLSACTTVVDNLSQYEIVTVLGTYRTWSYVELPDGQNGWVQTSRLEDPDAWTISINYDGGTPATPNPTTYDWGENPDPIVLAAASKSFFNFAGYQQVSCSNPDTNLGVPMQPTIIDFGLYGNLCFKAIFNLQSFNVTWDRNGGTGGAGGNTVSYQFGSPITVPGNPTWTGRIFNGWFTQASGGVRVTNSPSPTMGGADTTYYAQWTPASYSISYNYNGGSASPAGAQTYTFSPNSQSVSLGGAGRTCYTLSSFSSNLGTVNANTLTIPANATSPINITANWTAVSNTISINPNGGTGGGVALSSYTISGSNRDVALTRPTRTGYTFSSWTVTSGPGSVSGNTLTIPANNCGNITVTANWTINTYTVTFQRWDGTAMGTQNVNHGSTCTWPSTTLSGYTFWTWGNAAGANNTGTTYASCPTITSNQTFYAHYTRQVAGTFSAVYANDGQLLRCSYQGASWTVNTNWCGWVEARCSNGTSLTSLSSLQVSYVGGAGWRNVTNGARLSPFWISGTWGVWNPDNVRTRGSGTCSNYTQYF